MGENGAGLYAYAHSGTILISDTSIADNTATGSGGGAWFYATSDGEVRLENAEVTGNVASRNGGGIAGYAAFRGMTTIANSLIQGNELVNVADSSDGVGGGLYLKSEWNSSQAVTGSQIILSLIHI